MEGNTALGASSPAKPALHSPDPLSHTRAVLSSSSHIFSSDFLPYSYRRQSLQESSLLMLYCIHTYEQFVLNVIANVKHERCLATVWGKKWIQEGS